MASEGDPGHGTGPYGWLGVNRSQRDQLERLRDAKALNGLHRSRSRRGDVGICPAGGTLSGIHVWPTKLLSFTLCLLPRRHLQRAGAPSKGAFACSHVLRSSTTRAVAIGFSRFKPARSLSSFTRKDEAIAGGVLARSVKRGTVRIHTADGRIQEERTYPRSADPRRAPG